MALRFQTSSVWEREEEEWPLLTGAWTVADKERDRGPAEWQDGREGEEEEDG